MGKIKAVAFDLDGTIYLGEKIMPGVHEVLTFLDRRGVQYYFFTNNSSRTRDDFLSKLAGMGIRTSLEKVYSSAYATALYLRENGFHEVYCLGADGLKKEIECAGVRCVADPASGIDAVVVGLDMKFDYERMTAGLNLIRNESCKLVLCNRDRNFPVEGGKVKPGCGAIAASLEAAAGRTADISIGKPESFMLDILCRDWNLANNEVLIVGDTYDSDILMAERYGSPSVYIDLAGDSTIDTVTVKRIVEMIDIKEYFS